MSGPFPANANLSFEVASGLLVSDPKTGNKQPKKAVVEVQAYLKPDGRPRAIFWPGVNESEEPMVGRMVEPIAIPANIKHLAKAKASIGSQSGYFTLHIPTQSAFGVNEVLGDKIYGVFKPDP